MNNVISIENAQAVKTILPLPPTQDFRLLPLPHIQVRHNYWRTFDPAKLGERKFPGADRLVNSITVGISVAKLIAENKFGSRQRLWRSRLPPEIYALLT